MNKKLVYMISILSVIGLCSSVGAESAFKCPEDEWYGLYLGGYRVGYQHVQVKQSGANRKKTIEVLREIRTFYKDLPVDYRECVRFDSNLKPLHGEVSVKYQSVPNQTTQLMQTAYAYSDKKLYLKVKGEPKFQIHTSIPYKKIEPLQAWFQHQAGLRVVLPDVMLQSSVFCYLKFNPDGLEYKFRSFPTKASFRFLKQREVLSIHGKNYSTQLAQSLSDSGTFRYWIAEDGQIVKQEILGNGFSLIKEDANELKALKLCQFPSHWETDLPFQSDAKWPSWVEESNIRLSGQFFPALIHNDDRQTGTLSADGKTLDYHVAVQPFDSEKSLKLPIDPKGFKRYLKAEEAVESNAPVIQKLAKQIIGSETNAYTAALMLKDWAYQNIQYQFNTDRTWHSALDALLKKSGNCNDHSLLYTALARAAGIPTRLVYGYIPYQDKFSYHAWVESYVGKWVALEPTFGTTYVDATHLKVSEGTMKDLTNDLYWIYGHPEKAEILDFKYQNNEAISPNKNIEVPLCSPIGCNAIFNGGDVPITLNGVTIPPRYWGCVPVNLEEFNKKSGR